MWKKQLSEKLFSNNTSKLDPKQAIKLKYDNLPGKLYKYTSFNDQSIKMLENNIIKLSKPENFNDPYDCSLNLLMNNVENDYLKEKIFEYESSILQENFGFTQKELNRLKKSDDFVLDASLLSVKKEYPRNKYLNLNYDEMASNIAKNIRNSSAVMDQLKENYYITCFSEIKDSILMWGHYAKNHSGFCIEYDFKKLGINSYLNRFLFPVYYSEKIFDMANYMPKPGKDFKNILFEFSEGIDFQEIIKGLKFPEKTNSMNNMILFFAALNKFKDWNYEKEWRYVFPYKNTYKNPINIKTNNPTAIYLGAKIKNKEELLKLAKKRRIPVYQMEMKYYKFNLEPNLIQGIN